MQLNVHWSTKSGKQWVCRLQQMGASRGAATCDARRASGNGLLAFGGGGSGPSAHRLVDQVGDLLTGGCEGGGIASPVGPVGANGAGDFQRHVFLSELLEDLDVVEVFDAVAQPFQTHGGRDAGNADLLAGI